MSEVGPQGEQRSRRRADSFGDVADAYDRARPGYPREAVDWLVGRSPAVVVELGAGTGKLTEVLVAAGHDVLATDPLPEMLRLLGRRTRVPYVVGRAEQVPVASRSVDVVVCGQSFHWFDHEVALREIARVLRPGGHLALVWNSFDDSVPWVRRLHRLLNPAATRSAEGADPLLHTPHFGFVDSQRFRTWQSHTAATLADLTRSTSHVAARPADEVEEVQRQVRALYDDYGRGPDGMRVPYVTECFRAEVRHQEDAPLVPSGPVREQPDRPGEPVDDTGDDPGSGSGSDSGIEQEDTQPVTPYRRPPEDPGIQLIDFR